MTKATELSELAKKYNEDIVPTFYSNLIERCEELSRVSHHKSSFALPHNFQNDQTIQKLKALFIKDGFNISIWYRSDIPASIDIAW